MTVMGSWHAGEAHRLRQEIDGKWVMTSPLEECQARDKAHRKLGLWAIDTTNGNSWASLVSAMVSRSSADILMGQETKLFTVNGLRAAAGEARRNEWNPALTAAHPTSGTMGSGGNAVLARRVGTCPVAHGPVQSAPL